MWPLIKSDYVLINTDSSDDDDVIFPELPEIFNFPALIPPADSTTKPSTVCSSSSMAYVSNNDLKKILDTISENVQQINDRGKVFDAGQRENALPQIQNLIIQPVKDALSCSVCYEVKYSFVFCDTCSRFVCCGDCIREIDCCPLCRGSFDKTCTKCNENFVCKPLPMVINGLQNALEELGLAP